MDKKSLKWYETPAMELINVNVESQLLAGSPLPPGGIIDDDDDITGGNGGNVGF